MDTKSPTDPQNPQGTTQPAVSPQPTPPATQSTGYAPNAPISPTPPSPAQTPDEHGGEPVSPKVQTHLDNNPHANDPIKPHHTKKFYTVILLAVILLLAVIAGVLGYFLFLNKPTAANNTTALTTLPTIEPTPTVVEDPTVNWQTYQDARYNYSLKHPSDWRVVTSSQEPKPQELFISYDPNSSDRYLQRNPKSIDLSNKSILEINGVSVTRIKDNKDVYRREYAVMPLSTGTLIIEGTLDLELNQEQIATFEQIISTIVLDAASSISAEGTPAATTITPSSTQ